MSKYGQLIKEARKQESQKTRKTDDKVSLEPEVNLSIKVAAARRRHWAAATLMLRYLQTSGSKTNPYHPFFWFSGFPVFWLL